MRTGPLAAVVLVLATALLARALLSGGAAEAPPLLPEPGAGAAPARDGELRAPTRGDSPRTPREDLAPEPVGTAAATSPGDGAPAPPPATVLVLALRWTGGGSGVPVGGVAVEGRNQEFGEDLWWELGRTDAQGRLEAALPEPGRWRLGADEHSLPEGLLPPGDFPATGIERAPGLTLPAVELAPGERAEVTLWLMEERTVRGRVVDAGGAPAPGAFVRVDAFERRVRVPARSNGGPVGDDGRFEIDGLYPGEYQLSLAGQSWSRDSVPLPDWYLEQATANVGVVAPPALYVDLRERSLEGVELCVSRGRLAISGRLVDAEGRPVAGRDVSAELTHLADGDPDARHVLAAYPQRRTAGLTTSDGDGAFRLEWLDRLPLEVVVHGASVPRLAGGYWWVGDEAVAFALDPARDDRESIDLGDVVVSEVPLYRASGAVVIDEEQPGAGAFVLDELELDLRFEPGEDLRSLARDAQPRREYDRKTGRFQYVCIPPRDVATLWLYPRGEPGRGKAFRLYPRAGVVESGLLWSYP